MIARESFEKSLPRFVSAAPFLCLMLDHLLCPDTLLLPDELQKPPVDPRVVRQLRMEGRDEHAPLTGEHRVTVDLGEDLDARPCVLDPRRSDEHGPERLLVAGKIEIGLEARDLAAERIAPHR